MRTTAITTIALATSLAVCSSVRAQDAAGCPYAQQQPNTTLESKRALEGQIAERARQAAGDSVALEVGQKPKLALETLMLKTVASGALGSVITGAPYSAVTTTEYIQTLADGNRITSTTSFNITRDSMGRVRRELVDANGTVTAVMIMDPVAKVTYVLDPVKRTARTAELLVNTAALLVNKIDGVAAKSLLAQKAIETGNQPSLGVNAKPSMTTTEGAASVYVRKEALGIQSFDGVTAEGGRTVTTIPAGLIGNQLPIEIIAEHWYSMDLKLTVMTRNLDPRTGETTFRVSNLRRGNVDPAQFAVPADYTMTAVPSAPKPVIK